MSSTVLRHVTWEPGSPYTGKFSVVMDPKADMWLFRELADAVEPTPWMIDIRAAYLDVGLHVQSRLRDPGGEVEVIFEIQVNRTIPILRISQMVPSRLITGLIPFVV